jgi:hypothetical protein
MEPKTSNCLKDISQTNLQFAIQAIDNSFHSAGLALAMEAQGSCVNVAAEEISACSQERVVWNHHLARYGFHLPTAS